MEWSNTDPINQQVNLIRVGGRPFLKNGPLSKTKIRIIEPFSRLHRTMYLKDLTNNGLNGEGSMVYGAL